SITATSLANTESRTTNVPSRSVTAISREAVADAANRADERRAFCVVTQLLPNAADEDVDRPIVGIRIEASHGLHDPIASEHAAAVAHQQSQHLELGGRQRQWLPFQGRRPRGPVHLQRAEPEDLILVARAAAEHRLPARDELARLERLGDVIIRAELEADDAVRNVA